MLTVDLDRVVAPGDRVLDVGCGEGRHAHAAALRDARTVGLDLEPGRLSAAREGYRTELDGAGTEPAFLRGDALDLPFPDGAFDAVVCSEVLEHLPEYRPALAELERVLAPSGSLAVSVPRYGPERLCWALSEGYHDVEGGHVRVFDRGELRWAIERQGLRCVGSEHAHAFHSPYWWLTCLWWDRREDPPVPLAAYGRFLEWMEFEAPPAVSRIERAFDRVVGKSLVLYFEKP